MSSSDETLLSSSREAIGTNSSAPSYSQIPAIHMMHRQAAAAYFISFTLFNFFIFILTSAVCSRISSSSISIASAIFLLFIKIPLLFQVDFKSAAQTVKHTLGLWHRDIAVCGYVTNRVCKVVSPYKYISFKYG